MPTHSRVALFGGVYSNHVALRAAVDDAGRRGCDAMYCLGDLGAFGPNPDKVFPLLIDAGVVTVQGNYDNSIGHELSDCQCGYTDPADNYYARLSYQYTYAKTSPRWRPWLRGLAGDLRFAMDLRSEAAEGSPASADRESRIANRRSEISNLRSQISGRTSTVLLCHGSPRKQNEFLWESTTPTHLLERFCDAHAADVVVATHTGLPWTRVLPSGRTFVNCGVLGRPANDGTPLVGYTVLDAATGPAHVQLAYDHEALAAEMEAEDLPAPFVETIRTGWWTTCLEILPAKERARGKL